MVCPPFEYAASKEWNDLTELKSKLQRNGLKIGIRAPSNLGLVTFFPEKITQCPNAHVLESGCKCTHNG